MEKNVKLQKDRGCQTKTDQILADYQEFASSAIECHDEGFESAMTIMTLPERMRCFFQTSNHIERLNQELKWRSCVIGIIPNEAPLIRLIESVLIEQNGIIQARKAIFSKDSYQKLLRSDVRSHLHLIAEEQAALLAAELSKVISEGNLHTNLDLTHPCLFLPYT